MAEYEREIVTREPETVVIRRGGSSAGWWVAAIVAIVAIFGVLFMVNNNPDGCGNPPGPDGSNPPPIDAGPPGPDAPPVFNGVIYAHSADLLYSVDPDTLAGRAIASSARFRLGPQLRPKRSLSEQLSRTPSSPETTRAPSMHSLTSSVRRASRRAAQIRE